MHILTFVTANSIVEGGGLDTTRAGEHLTTGLGYGVCGPVMTIVRFIANCVYMYVLEVAKTLTQYCANNANG